MPFIHVYKVRIEIFVSFIFLTEFDTICQTLLCISCVVTHWQDDRIDMRRVQELFGNYSMLHSRSIDAYSCIIINSLCHCVLNTSNAGTNLYNFFVSVIAQHPISERRDFDISL